MSIIMNFRVSVILPFLLLAPVISQAQTDQKAAELKRLETAVATAKAKVDLNERKLTIADSLITAGTQLIAESKTGTKAIEAERKKLDKEHATRQKSLTKLSTSKDKEESTKARADLKALDVQYRADAKALDTRLRDATKMMTTGNSSLNKGKASKKSVQDALKNSRSALEAAQAKYDVASGTGENAKSKDKKKK